MTNEDEDRSAKAARVAEDARSAMAEREAAAKATLDNMARLRALRLAREAAEPQRAPTAGKARTGTKTRKPAEKTPALSDWLASQQSGGRRI
jgi:hypothetical protein